MLKSKERGRASFSHYVVDVSYQCWVGIDNASGIGGGYRCGYQIPNLEDTSMGDIWADT